MPTIVCRRCGKPWMDTKFARCPACNEPKPGDDTQPSEVEADADGTTRSAGWARAAAAEPVWPVAGADAPAAAASGGNPGAGSEAALVALTAQVRKIQETLEDKPPVRVEVAVRAEKVSGVLAVLAVVFAGLVGIAGFFQFFVVVQLNPILGFVSLLASAVGAVMTWVSFTYASVVAGYIANRSR